MGDLTLKTPKPLLAINGESAVVRLLRQLLELGVTEITVVIGYKGYCIAKTIGFHFGSKIKFVENPFYQTDVNAMSVVLGVGLSRSPFIVFESDCVFDNASMDMILGGGLAGKSSWFSVGPFVPGQVGGILRSARSGVVEDISVVPRYEEKFSVYRKLIGVLRVGPNEIESYMKFLREAVSEDMGQYYLAPWIRNSSMLPSWDTDLSGFKVGAFNTVEDYNHVKSLFESGCVL